MEILILFGVWLVPPVILLIVAPFAGRKTVSSQNAIVSIIFVWISLFAALRYQTGDDWYGYETYFNAIDVRTNIIEGYLGTPLLLQFEPGYYVVSYIFKSLGFSYLSVNAFSVFVLAFALLRFNYKEKLPLYIVLLIFAGLPQLTLYYNQVRQALAIGLVLLAIQSNTKKSFVIYGVLALSFQISVVIFLILGLLARFKSDYVKKIFKAGLIGIPFSLAFVMITNLSAYDLLRAFLPENFQFKIDVYQEEGTNFGIFRLVTILYIIFSSIIIFKHYKKRHALTTKHLYIMRMTLLCSLLVPYSVILFPNSYAFFNRGLVFALIILSLSGSILHKYALNNVDQEINLASFYGLGLISVAYYFIALYVYEPVYIPYKSFFSL